MIYTVDDIIGKNQSPTILGKQIVCISEFWYLKKIREVGQNTLAPGGDVIFQEYDKANGTSYSKKGEAWCSIFCWFIINELNKAYNTNIYFPNYKELGVRASAAIDSLKKKYAVDYNPTPGSIFYRKSETSGVSGHMGIVIFIDQINKKFYTVEGNIQLADGSEGVGVWEYSFGEISSRGFLFAHVEEYNWQYKIVQDYNGRKCQPEEKKEDIKKEEIKTGSGSITTGEATKKSLTGSTSSTQQQTTVIDKSKCKEIVISAPAINNATNIDVFANNTLNPAIAADILEMDAQGVTSAERNGAALGYIGSGADTGEASGFGMFRLAGSNVGVYILPKTSTKAKQLAEAGLISGIPQPIMADRGTNHLMYSTNAIVLTHSHDPMDNRTWKISNHQIMNGKGTYFPLKFHDSKTAADPDFEAWRRNWTSRDRLNFKDLLIDLNQKAGQMRLTKPVVIVIDKTEDYTFADRIQLVKKITSAMVNFVPGIGQYAGYINEALTATEEIAKNGFAGIISSAEKIYNIAKVLAPTEIKGAEDYFLKIGQKAFSSPEGSIKLIGDLIGLDASVVSGLTKRYTSISESIIDFTKTIDSNLNNVVCKAQNYLNHLLVDKAGRAIKSDRFLDAILNNELLSSNIFNDILLINHQKGILPTIPGIGKLAIQMITDPDQTMFKNIVDAERLKQGLIKTSLGYVTDKNLFDNWLISTLNEQAGKAIEYFVLPAGIDENKKECFSYIIQQETGRKVINCPKGWTFDPISKKCSNSSQTGWNPNLEVINKDISIETRNDIIYKTGKCPTGMVWNELLGVCVNVEKSKIINCPDGTKDDGKGNCIPIVIKCPENTIWDETLKACVPKVITCQPGTIWNPQTGKCEAISIIKCPDGTVYNPITGKCEAIKSTSVKLPPCISISNGKYYYNPNWKNIPTPINPVKDTVVVKPNEVAKPINTNNTLLAPDNGISFNKDNGIKTTIPVSSALDINKVSTSLPNVLVNNNLTSPKVGATSIVAPQGKVIGLPQVETKAFYGLSDELFEAAVSDQGSPMEKWYVKINGEWQYLIDCVPTPAKAPEISCPEGYRKTTDGKCEPIPVEPKKPTEPPYEPVKPELPTYPPYEPQKPTVPPYEPVKPELPTYPPYEPQKPTVPPYEPVKPELPTYPPYEPQKPTVPPYEPVKPELPTYPPYEPQKPSDPPTEKRIPPSDPPDGDCPCNQPKMEIEFKKKIYKYPKSDEHCCDNGGGDCQEFY